jgi:hypothetical protein
MLDSSRWRAGLPQVFGPALDGFAQQEVLRSGACHRFCIWLAHVVYRYCLCSRFVGVMSLSSPPEK